MERRSVKITQSQAGYLVETASGKKGRTYHRDRLAKGKVCVYIEDSGEKLLCEPESLKVIGFVD